jgi:hypothetical protein
MTLVGHDGWKLSTTVDNAVGKWLSQELAYTFQRRSIPCELRGFSIYSVYPDTLI